ncbi:hypothetical protein IQ268_02810 [Oculatella sp. LEGE 06141]|uniref:hypothetical protein n=1 Tax=Oculatella sp. LEGE 06141 TaxID=1828648 RepID=UPI0018826259|nr:hypothetical protein [Oculatella sp. LEGE 06141]MBE9177507.1 hypothetical protein [Oculatella sp. LEGE 06141]
MKSVDPFENKDVEHLQIFIYLIPVIGFFPAIWTLYRHNGSRAQRVASRLAVTLALGWILGYFLLGVGAHATDGQTLRLLIVSSLLTSGYFLANIWLMVRLWQRKSLWLPGVSSLSSRLP